MRAFLLIILIAIGAFIAYTYWGGSITWRTPSTQSVGTTGTIDAKKARETGAELGEKAAAAANRVGETVSEAATTTKIKAKLALDDTVKARRSEERRVGKEWRAWWSTEH